MMKRFAPVFGVLVSCVACAPVLAAPAIIDDFEDISRWEASAPEGVTVKISHDENGKDGAAIRIDYDFITGGGYCVVQRKLDLPLPENYRFDFDVRGEGLPNNLEFKIAGPPNQGGVDVWWVNRRAFEPPKEWTSLVNKKRSFEYAWGPSGGQPLPSVAGIEIAIAMSHGGKGTIWLDNLTFEPLEAPKPYTATPRVRAAGEWHEVKDGEPIGWPLGQAVSGEGVEIDFQQPRDFGAVVLAFDAAEHAISYDLESSADGKTWKPIAQVRQGVGGFDHFFTPDGNAKVVRIRWADADHRAILRSFEMLPLDVGDDINEFVSRVATDSLKGWYPKQFTGKQCFWTVVGAPGSGWEGLLSEFGAFEPIKGGPTLEPFLLVDDKLITWADATVTCSLVDNYIPIPAVTWAKNDLTLEITALAPAPSESAQLRYRVTNTGAIPRTGSFALALRPFQVLPPWQRLNIAGGVSRLERAQIRGWCLVYNEGFNAAEALTRPTGSFAASSTDGDVVEQLGAVRLPEAQSAVDASGLASAAMTWAFELASGQSTDIFLRVPLTKDDFEAVDHDPVDSDQVMFENALAEATEKWRALLNRAEFTGPPATQHMWDTVRSNLGYILINADGPSIQPGSRAYERSWIRDGSLTGTALLTMGHADLVESFLRWYSDHLYDNGKVPCVVDRRGPDPYPEHDSPGQYIYLLVRTVLTTGDIDLARGYYPKALAAIGYIESLRATRMTPEYADPTNMLHAFYGILPESGSHEGYMNKPMHSFWDDFFCLKGLKDMVKLAEIVGDTENLPRLIALRDDFRIRFDKALRRAITDANIDYIPGCVELGDFDAASTAIGIFPCGELGWMPEPQTQRTFDKYWSVIEHRRADTIKWHDYTPYETRIIGIFVLLGQPHRALELMDWLFRDQLPKGWNQWGEVAYREPEFPGWVGDMPHTWVGSGYISSVRAMFVDERESDDALVLAQGVVPEWLTEPEGIALKNWPTEFGVLSYRLSGEPNRIVLEVDGGLREPSGGIVFVVPGEARIVSAKDAHGTVLKVSGREVHIPSVPSHIEVVTE